MNGFGHNPTQGTISSLSAPQNPPPALPNVTPPIAPTAPMAGSSHLNVSSQLSNGTTASSAVTRTSPSPFASAPSPSPTPSFQSQNIKPTNSRLPSTDSLNQGGLKYTLPNNNVVSGKSQDGFPPQPYTNDTNSITGKRKRADSSPVKGTSIPWAQRQHILADFRKNFLSVLTEHDTGISLLDKPLPNTESSHEPKKSKILTNPNDLLTLRQRLSSDEFYVSLPKLVKDVNAVADDAMAIASNTSAVAPEDEMQDDDATPQKFDVEKVDRIRKFQDVAQDLLSKAAAQHPYLNAIEEKAIAEDTPLEDIDSADEDIEPHYKWAVAVTENNKTFYSMVHPPQSDASKTSKPNADDMEIDNASSKHVLHTAELVPQARLIMIHQSNPTTKSMKLKDRYPTPRSQAVRPLTIHNEKTDREEKKNRNPATFEWLSYGEFSSFAPNYHQGGDVTTAEAHGMMWFDRYGQRSLEKALSEELRYQDLEENDDKEFKKLAEDYEPIPIDPALFDSETKLETALREISDILTNLHSTVQTRLKKHNHPTQISKPEEPERKLHSEAQERIAKILGEIEPEHCDKLYEILEMAPSLESGIMFHKPAVMGSMPTPREAPAPAPAPTPQPHFTTRVSYGGDGSFTPTARVVSTRTHTPNQYTRTPSFSQQSYPQQPPPSRPQFNQAPAYYPPQQYPQQRQAMPQTPQYQNAGYAPSPFSRTPSGNVPRIASSGTPQVYIQHGNTTYQQPAIRTTGGFMTQSGGQGSGHHATPRRVSMVPQTQTPQRPPSGQAQPYHYTPGHAQYTQMAAQMQQNILRQAPTPQHGQPTQGQFAYHQQQQQQIRPAVQPMPTRPGYPGGYQAHGRIFSANQPSTPSGTGQQ